MGIDTHSSIETGQRPTGRTRAERPTVLQVLPALHTGGAERGCVDVATALVRSGGRALVASSGGPLVRELTRAGAEHIVLPLASKNPFVMRKNVGRLVDLVERNNVDIVHARSRAPAWSAIAAARRTGRPFLTTFHGKYSEGNYLKRLYNSVMVRGELVIAISEHIETLIQTRYGVDPARIRLIPRGIDLEVFNPAHVAPSRLVQLARQWRLQDGMPVIMLPGRLTRWKGHHVLLDALARLGRLDVRCVLVGSDQGRSRYRRELERRILRLGLTPIVHIVDHCNDMAAAYMLSDVVVSASTEPEPFGRVTVEAQAMGRPVIASDHGGSREIVIASEMSWLTTPGDAEALAEALSQALALDPRVRERLAESVIARAHEQFAKETMCERTLAVYDELRERAVVSA
ncbi:MAG TPA: glycosyltransferase family 4 protein [Alphaproteobacteria bacterium]|nr:glycosyltransferase family 4 protein [Alphaproteobacteria bacterium]